MVFLIGFRFELFQALGDVFSLANSGKEIWLKDLYFRDYRFTWTPGQARMSNFNFIKCDYFLDQQRSSFYDPDRIK